ncbi:hypothetical protein PINS_up022621 [Pythium insidiosum]|nr:hypothetical protein PINS_up022621 [Pythium insidiosum]
MWTAGFEVLGAVYEVSTVVTDVVLNAEYIRRKWIEEYALSIAFLVFNGVVMAIVGVAMDAQHHPQRFSRFEWLNIGIGSLVGLLQLRVLTETVSTFVADRRTAQPGQQHTTNTQEAAREQKQRQAYVAFVQAIVRDVPIFVIQANATIHYRKWKLLDLWAVISTGVTLLHAVVSFTARERPRDTASSTAKSVSTAVRVTGELFMAGQFVFRLSAILLVATTTGLTIIWYALALVLFAIAATVVLGLATPVASMDVPAPAQR